MHTRRRALICALVVALALLATSGLAAHGSRYDRGRAIVSPAQALSTIRSVAPELVEPNDPAGTPGGEVEPALAPAGPALAVVDSHAEAAIDRDADAGFAVVDEPGSTLRFEPRVASSASGPQLVGSDAVLFANTQPAADTLLRPTAVGVEAFTALRSPAAPEAYGWRVGGLDGDQHLVQLGPSRVAVVDRDAPEAEVGDPTLGGDRRRLRRGPRTPGALVREGEDRVTSATAQLDDAARELVAAQRAVRSGTVVAIVALPWAKDARGFPVAASYAVRRGNEIVLTVRHRGLGRGAYPVVADPAVATLKAVARAARRRKPRNRR